MEMIKKARLNTFRIIILITAIAQIGCAAVKTKDYTKFHQTNPHSILIVPPINNSSEIGADDYFLATVSLPLAERGYYVFPVNMSKELLLDGGLSDPGLVHRSDPARLGQLFGADAILYINIEKWEAKYLLLNTIVSVSFSYVMKDARSGEEIWSHHQDMQYTPQNQNTGNLIANLVVAAVNAAVTKAAPITSPWPVKRTAPLFCQPTKESPQAHIKSLTKNPVRHLTLLRRLAVYMK